MIYVLPSNKLLKVPIFNPTTGKQKKTDLETKKKGRPRVSVCVDGRREMAGAVARLIFDSHLKSSSIIIN